MHEFPLPFEVEALGWTADTVVVSGGGATAAFRVEMAAGS
jgi:hypothetical protein